MGPNISPHYIPITFAPLHLKNSNLITFATILVGSPPGAISKLQISILFYWLVSSQSNYNALRWMPWDLTEDKSTFVQVMAWCRQATSHYLSQCWPSSMSPYGVARPQWDQEPVCILNSVQCSMALVRTSVIIGAGNSLPPEAMICISWSMGHTQF